MQSTLDTIIPRPVSVKASGSVFSLTTKTRLYIEPNTSEMTAIAQYLVEKLKPATGFELSVIGKEGEVPEGNFYLTTSGGDLGLGEEGYELTITPEAVKLSAYRPAGLFHGIQTLRQILPASIESPVIQPGPWQIPTGIIRDFPRFAWRGVMLDVSRHFFNVPDVERFIDLAALYKLNRFHMHLSDDQGWRIMINSWPNLATYGGSTGVGGGPGGFYT